MKAACRYAAVPPGISSRAVRVLACAGSLFFLSVATATAASPADAANAATDPQICTFATCGPRSGNPLASSAAFGLAVFSAGLIARRRTPSPA